ncbi:MAG: phosphoribosylformylglycinamidine cyclo-ligase [Christensenellaceae bacterium]|jgi:phosphoribosylformylglycinamidine cyclo-ligase|nr:phosphoribosylformylglycinamidine cyclo-ligase [Christensenellaceae bacterium]MBS6564840.1 phosphoribosylformylglycinamidine cyclo-ligase [Clostridiales bacterium]PWL99843.1 MAG: phosphoribosylformylglycinamidine cyclo-ligase [Selenomonadales bacterium]
MISYKDAGVDVQRGYDAVSLMKKHVQKTMNSNVLGDLGSFGGFYALDKEDCDEPVLVAGTDGVGTKLRYAMLMDKHDTIGIDAVAMCVNDIVCQGAKPLFFLDYIATGRIHPDKIADIVGGVAEGCVQAGCALIGGETAEMPGFYGEDEYDIAGFSVGVVQKSRVINGSSIKAGDALIGLASSGIHSNGFSLVRRLFGENPSDLTRYSAELKKSVGEEVLTPTRIYVRTVLELIKNYQIKGIAHITGGGFIENIPRMLPKGLKAKINTGSYEVLPVFNVLAQLSGLEQAQLYNTFNMGVGMVLAVEPGQAESIAEAAAGLGEKAYIIGEVVQGEGGVELCR